MSNITAKIYKIYGTKCIRKFDSIEAAKSWCWTVNTGESYRIEVEVKGERPRNIYL